MILSKTQLSLLSLVLTVTITSPARAACAPQNANLQNTRPDAHFTVHGDGTVTDRQSGLMWTQCALGLTYDGQVGACESDNGGSATEYPGWSAAISATVDANNTTLLGYDDWRLPNIKELASLADLACGQGGSTASATPDQNALNDEVFDLTLQITQGGMPVQAQLDYLYSSTTHINLGSDIRMLSVSNGSAVFRSKLQDGGVLLVRDPD